MVNMEKIISLPSLIWDKGITGDGGRRMWVTTNELNDEQSASVMKVGDNKTFGWFLFKKSEIEMQDTLDLPEIKMEFKDDKSPAKRLRSTIFVYWKKKFDEGLMKCDFDTYYKKTVEHFIDKVKEMI